MHKNTAIILFLIIFSSLIYSYQMGNIGLTDPDETFYAQTAKEMIANHNFSTPLIFNHPQFEKPVFFYWLLIVAFKLFGTTAWAARFWPALFGVLGVVITFLMGKTMFSRRVGLYAASILATSFLYLGLSRATLTDIVLTVSILLSMFFFYLGEGKTYKNIYYTLSYGFAGLAVLTKGPIGIIMPLCVISLFFIIQKERTSLKRFLFCWQGWLLFLIVALPWYAFVSLKFGKGFLYGFFIHENLRRFFIAEHHSFNRWYFYPAVILLGVFPWSALLPFMFSKAKHSISRPRAFLNIWFWFTLLFFTLAQSKLSSYILPLFPALSLLLANTIVNLASKPTVNKRRMLLSFLASTVMTLFFVGAFIYSIIWIRQNFPDLFLIALIIESILAIAICSLPLLVFKKKPGLALILNLTSVFTVIILTFNYLMPGLEGAFSDKMLLSRIPKDRPVQKKILCNKIFVRGVHYYTNWPVAVINCDKRPFYTPHPIDILSTDSELKKFFSGKKDIICVLKESDLKRIDEVTSGERKNSIAYKNGNRVVIISSPLYSNQP